MKQYEFAEKAGVTPTFMSFYIRGKRNVSIATAQRFVDVGGKDLIFWMTATPEQRAEAVKNAGNGKGGE